MIEFLLLSQQRVIKVCPESVIINCLISGGIPVILRSSGDGKTVEISSKGEQTKTEDKEPPDNPGPTSPVEPIRGQCSGHVTSLDQSEVVTTEVTSGAGRERGSVSGQSDTTGSTRQMGLTTGQVRTEESSLQMFSEK